MIYLHRTMVVPDAWAATVRSLCNGMGPGGSGSNMFLVPLSATGTGTATHWISAGAQGDDFCAILPLTTFTTDAGGVTTATTRPGQPDTIVYLAGQAGITVTRAQIDAMLAAVEVTDQAWPVSLARRNLQTIPGALP